MRPSQRYGLCASLLACAAVCSGCATANTAGPVKLRSMQARDFDTADKKKMLQAVIGTMQDLDFAIDKADYTLGTVTGSKYLGDAVAAMDVTVKPRGATQLLVWANAHYGAASVKEAATYQDFFVALEKALFLTAQQVD